MLEYLDLIVTAVSTLVAVPVVKNLIISTIPQTAPFFALFNPEAKELGKVVTAANSDMNKNADLRKWALENGLKIAAKLIKK